MRIVFARFLERGESREDPGREYPEVYHAQDEAVPRIRRLPHGQLVHTPGLYTEDERKTSPTYNEFLARAGTRNGLYARFDGPDALHIAWNLGYPVGGAWESARLRLLESLLPHVHRTVLFRQALARPTRWARGPQGAYSGPVLHWRFDQVATRGEAEPLSGHAQDGFLAGKRVDPVGRNPTWSHAERRSHAVC